MSTILGSQKLINGNTQQTLADQWWSQTSSTPVDVHPFFSEDTTDPRGMRGSIERHENFQSKSSNGVFLLGGTFGGLPVVRTIVGRPDTVYFAPFANLGPDNTTVDFSPESGFPGGYALTPKHLADLKAQGLNPRDPSALVGGEPGSIPTLLDLARFFADNFMGGQFVAMDGHNATPHNMEKYRQETADLGYAQLLRSTGAMSSSSSSSSIYVADPNLGKNLKDSNPSNDKFPKLSDINPDGNKAVVPFVQAGYYFAFELDPGSHTLHFGDTVFGQDITYNILNPIEGSNQKDVLVGTSGNDYLVGKDCKDSLLGAGGDDLLVGGNGSDYLKGGSGSDELWGDKGSDTFVFKKGYGLDTIYDFGWGDQIRIKDFATVDIAPDPVLLPGGESTKIDFGGGDVLQLVGVIPNELSINHGVITLA